MELTRIRLKDIIDDRFCILDEKKQFRNRDYRSLPSPYSVESRQGIGINTLEVRTRSVIDRLALRYGPEAISRPSSSMIEISFEHLSFGWADIRADARFLVFGSEKTGFTPAKMARWLRRNCTQDALILEGNTRCRVSFASEEDFLLARLQFS